MSASHKWFDTDAELQKLRDTPPKAHKVGTAISHFSDLKQGPGEKVKERQSPPLRGRRDFLPRPLGQEDSPTEGGCWVPLFDWLIDHSPEHFHAVYDAEEYLAALERQGITSGRDYEQACQELRTRFETARRLKLTEGFKIWMQ